MSFDEKFKMRWERVICPAVSRIECNGKRMTAQRVDTRTISDSILTEILSGIATARLVLADVSTIEKIGDRPIRNGNVMYEVGIAHAARLPEEVLLFRSDDDPLLFDVANIRVNKYDPDSNPAAATEAVADSIVSALREIDLRKTLAISHAVDSLDFPSWWLLAETGHKPRIEHPPHLTMRDALGNAQRVAAIHRLLDIGAIRASFLRIDPEKYAALKDSPDAQLMSYEITEFGNAVFREGIRRMGLDNPEMAKILESEFQRGAVQMAF
jgi:hypothetical protein